MNYGAYMRKGMNTRAQVIGFQNGQDASMVTMKRQARANSQPFPGSVATNSSKIGGTVGNIMEATQQTSFPTDQVCASGYKGVMNGIKNADSAANLIGAAQYCAVSSDAPSSAPYSVVVPPGIFIDPVSYNPNPNTRQPMMTINATTGVQTAVNAPAWTNTPTQATAGNAPGQTVCCADDPSQLTRMDPLLDAKRVTSQGLQSALRTSFNLPPKLEGLRGAVYNASRN